MAASGVPLEPSVEQTETVLVTTRAPSSNHGFTWILAFSFFLFCFAPGRKGLDPPPPWLETEVVFVSCLVFVVSLRAEATPLCPLPPSVWGRGARARSPQYFAQSVRGDMEILVQKL